MKNLEIHEIDVSTSLPLQYADEGIRAGFPGPAQDYKSLELIDNDLAVCCINGEFTVKQVKIILC